MAPEAGVAEPLILTLRMDERSQEWSWLGAQDRQGFKPRVTVRNKVSPKIARALHERRPREGA
jgi:hypothetical protein